MSAKRDWTAFRAEIAELIIAKRMTLKAAAYHLGINEKTLAYHLGKVHLQIRNQKRK